LGPPSGQVGTKFDFRCVFFEQPGGPPEWSGGYVYTYTLAGTKVDIFGLSLPPCFQLLFDDFVYRFFDHVLIIVDEFSIIV
jgi:hypothetical protein